MDQPRLDPRNYVCIYMTAQVLLLILTYIVERHMRGTRSPTILQPQRHQRGCGLEIIRPAAPHISRTDM